MQLYSLHEIPSDPHTHTTKTNDLPIYLLPHLESLILDDPTVEILGLFAPSLRDRAGYIGTIHLDICSRYMEFAH